MIANLRDIGRQQSEIKINSYRQASFGSPDRQLKPEDFEGEKLILYVSSFKTHWQLLPITLVKSAMVQSTCPNNIGRDEYTIPLNSNTGPVPKRAQLIFWRGI